MWAPKTLPLDSRKALWDAHHRDEAACVEALLDAVKTSQAERERISKRAHTLITQIRKSGRHPFDLDAFMQEYELSTPEGVALMCLAEALLRIPDVETQDALIKDKIGTADWSSHQGHGGLFVNASTWALKMTGRFVVHGEDGGEDGGEGWSAIAGFAQRAGDAIVREAVLTAMKILGRKFVLGETIGEALENAEACRAKGYDYSFDMLGEAAVTAAQAEHHFQNYKNVIARLQSEDEISIKLSALHPRYAPLQSECVSKDLIPRVLELAERAADAGIALCIDAEESERLDLSLDVLDAVSGAKNLRKWNGLGLAVQAYQKRAWPLIGWLEQLAQRDKRRLRVRLVKGAYWDREIKRAQVLGLDGFPVFTRKTSSDVSFLVCARRLMERGDLFYPAFASHNAHTIAAVQDMVSTQGGVDFEFQKLHGMGDELFDMIIAGNGAPAPVRIYAPIGEHEELLPYLVRRLLENGANSSFVNRVGDPDTKVENLARDPVETLSALKVKPHPAIVLPKKMFNEERKNSQGIDLADQLVLNEIQNKIKAHAKAAWTGGSVIGGTFGGHGGDELVYAPFEDELSLGRVYTATPEDVGRAFDLAAQSQPEWDHAGALHRAGCLERAADLYELHMSELMALCIYEGGKTLTDAVAEVREAVDFLRYYAYRARLDLSEPEFNPGPTGERNQTQLVGRGVFACISPWNFPLAIFTGQVAAALAAGNAVLAKPAGPTPMIALEAVNILHQAGVPVDVLHLLVGPSGRLSEVLLGHRSLSGVAFTGSGAVAGHINGTISNCPQGILPLIAETGGLNAMIVDSSALPEQVARDTLTSAFHSAGQRCSALRALFVQNDVADRVIETITGAMAELEVGDPRNASTDVGPLINRNALADMQAHVTRMRTHGELLAKVPMDDEWVERGSFFAPRAYQVDSLDAIGGEVFGPILHILRYQSDRLDDVIEAINATGYGLTLGIHSRIEHTINHIVSRAHVGNIYVNRSQIGAVVGVQPFGGEGLSGTGPKAGGPRYLHRFCKERTLSIDTTASGGNASLMTLDDDEA